MVMKASLLIEAKDNASAVFGRIAGNAKKMGAGFKPVASGIAAIGTKAMAPLTRADRFLTQFNRNLRNTGVYADIAKRGMASLGSGVVRLGTNIASSAASYASWAAIAAAGGVGWFVKGIIEAGSKFEQFQVILENSEGSAAKAKMAMDWVKQFASSTPYELEQVMQAFVALKSYGIDPTDGSLRSVGNAASGMGKDIMQAVEMMADAQTGEFERLKEFGIRASKEGNKVRFTYMSAGKEMSRTAKNSGNEIKTALTGIFDERFGGMMERQSKTLAGTWSNIKDMFSNFQLDVANAGIFDLIKEKAQKVFTKLQGWAKDGTLKAWAERISERLERMVLKAEEFVTTGGFDRVAKDIKTVARAAEDAANALKTAYSWLQQLDRFQQKITLTGQSYSPFDRISKPAIKRLGEIREQDVVAPAIKKLYQKPGSPIFIKGQAPKALPMKSRKTASADVGGRLDINISAPKGYAAKITKMASNNPNVEMRTGKVSRG